MSESADLVSAPAAGRDAEDFLAIERAMLESARGRWFLLEYARRQRAGETQRLLDAIARLESVVTGVPQAALALPAPVTPLSTDGAASAQLIAAQLSEIVWNLREAGASQVLCDALDDQVALLANIADRSAPAAIEAQQCAESESAPADVMESAAVRSAAEPPEAIAERPPSFSYAACRAALSRLDDLPFEDRLALFA